MPTVALQYLTLLNNQNKYSGDSEGTKYERFKFDYEYIKLHLEYNNNREALSRFIGEYQAHVEKIYVLPLR